MRIKISIYKLLIYVYMLFLTLPIVSSVLPTVANMLFCLLVGGCILLKTRTIKSDSLILIICCLVVLLIQQIGKNGWSVSSIYAIYYNLLPLLVGIYLIDRETPQFCENVMRVLFLGNFITCITTIYALIKEPDISRMLAIGDENVYALTKWGNVGGFEFIYSIDLLLLYCVVLYKKKIISTLIFCIIFIPGIFCIVLSQYTLALLFLLPPILMIIFTSSRTRKWNFYIITGISFLLLLNRTLLQQTFDFITSLTDSKIVNDRIDYLSDVYNGIDATSDVSLRFDAYAKSLEALWDNLFSVSYFSNIAETGGHSTILDILGTFGLLGIVLIVLYYCFLWKKNVKNYIFNCNDGYFKLMILVIFLLQIVNPISWTHYSIVMIIPIMGVILKKEHINKEEQEKVIILRENNENSLGR